ncbi:MAG: penicillin-binding protein 1C, partial [Cyclobacteriaceae bacterium]|nr:penicillin-binding protein 1C [Cyclobacteriaceae bacterium]
PDYVVGTWFGNADGEGRNGLTGVSVAAPVMFELFKILPVLNLDFSKPESRFVKMKVCVQSGKKAGELCTEIREDEVLKNALNTTVCDFHEWIHLDKEGNFRVHGNCYPVSEMIHKSWFLLPPVQHYYFSRQNPSYAILPSWKGGCFEEDSKSPMRFIYPQNNAKIFIPRNLDGENSHAVFEVAHNQNNIAINWHLDGEFLGQTRGLNKMEFNKIPGKHNLTIVDENGNIQSINFTVIAQEY